MNGGGQIRRQNLSVFQTLEKLNPCEKGSIVGGWGRGDNRFRGIRNKSNEKRKSENSIGQKREN